VGASRTRLARQLLVESALLASLGAAAGLLMAALAGPLLMRAIPVDPAAAAFDVRFDWRLVAFTAAVSGAAALTAACASLFRALRADPATVLHGGGRSIVHGRRRLTHALIAAQVACSLLLLIAGVSMLQTLNNLRRVDPGFDAGNAFAVRVDSSAAGVEAQALPAYFSAVHERILAAPGVGRASFAQLGLMTQAATTGTVDVAGRATPDADRLVRLFWVGPHFFEAAGMRMVAGRSIGEAESTGAERVAVVNQAFARHYFEAPDAALGRLVNRDVRIIGIVQDARYNTLRDEPVRAMFLPHTQAPPRGVMTFVVRPSGEHGQAVSAVTAALRAFGPRLKVRISPLGEVIDATVARERFVAGLAAVLSALALFLSCAGLYAAVAQGVAERKAEMAVRLALGATGRDVIRLILTDPLRTTLIGIALGVPIAYGLMRSIASLLFGVAPFEPLTVVVCALFLVAIAALAAFVPARRATGIDPQECLKTVS
jgi:predicted permease